MPSVHSFSFLFCMYAAETHPLCYRLLSSPSWRSRNNVFFTHYKATSIRIYHRYYHHAAREIPANRGRTVITPHSKRLKKQTELCTVCLSKNTSCRRFVRSDSYDYVCRCDAGSTSMTTPEKTGSTYGTRSLWYASKKTKAFHATVLSRFRANTDQNVQKQYNRGCSIRVYQNMFNRSISVATRQYTSYLQRCRYYDLE